MPRRLLPSATGLSTALLAVCVHLVLTACTTLSPRVDPGSAPIAWQATDFRVITRTIDGVERTLYTFMLVLAETQGSGITLTQLNYTTHHPGFALLPAAERATILWKLRPYGELRQFFYSSPCCSEAHFGIRGRRAPAWHILLTGTNDHGQPVRVVIDLSLPQPPVPTQREAEAPPRAALATPAPVPTVVGSAVPFATMRHTVLVHAVLNHQEPVTLLLDTGATRTLLTPDIARRLESNPEPNAPTTSMVTLGGQQGELPLIRLASLAVGDAVVEGLQVGVFTALPHAPFIDGLLGGDFLKHFTLRLDYAQSRLQLMPQDMPDPSSHLTASPAAAVLSTTSTEVIDNHMLVHAMLNHTEPVTLLLDTGTTYTMLTPETARRVGLYPTQHRPRGLLKVVGGQEVRFPLVPVAALAMGDAVVTDLQVGILAAFPGTRPVDGLLGGDFLEHFTLTLDYSSRRLEITPALSSRRGAEDR
jgi:predicted aspartyl protease